jgi:colanic acid biosynthesis glycosyl transferase WcaI
VPVLYSGAGEGARLVQAAKAGLVTEPEDAGAMAEAIVDLLDDPILAKQLGANGRAYVEKHMSWSALVADWLYELESRSGERRNPTL